MKFPTPLKRAVACASLMIVACVLSIATAPAVHAAAFGPYTPDADTLHLWHFDETNAVPLNQPTNGIFYDAASNPATTPIALFTVPGKTNEPVQGFPPTMFTLQGQPAFTNAGSFLNYGYSVMTTQYACVLPTYTATNGTAVIWNCPTNLSDFINPVTGAFTFEAMVRPAVNPLTYGSPQEIVCGDSGFAARAWQFRFPGSGKLEFNFISDSSAWVHDVFAVLPSTGPDAAAAGNWYHVAVTYTGFAPTNSDTAKQFKFYWTLMDVTRTNADLLFTTNITYGFTNSSMPLLGIGGSARGSIFNNVANNEGLIGNIDEVRISRVCRTSTQMIFNPSVFVAPPSINIAANQTNQLVGYGQTLQIAAAEGGTLPITNQWYLNGAPLAGQTSSTLTVSNLTFAGGGNYQLLATNAAGPTAGAICTITVGAAFNGLFNGGVDNNGTPLWQTAPGTVDPHYQLTQSPDTTTVSNQAFVLPGQPTGAAAQPTVFASWIDSRSNGGGPVGTYNYQTQFQLDNGDVASAVLSGSLLVCGPKGGDTLQIFLNGVETDVTLAGNPILVQTPFTITNGLEAGSNTLDFVVNADGGNTPNGALYVQMTGIGNVLPPGLPVFNSTPASETVQYGTTAVVPAVVVGRPPLSFQWYSNGIPVNPLSNPSAATETLTFGATNVTQAQVVGGSFTANYTLVAANDSGSITSAVAAVSIQIPPQSLVSAGEPIWEATNDVTNLVVIFSQPVDPASATTAGNYALNNGASVLSAAQGDTPAKIILSTSVLAPGTAYNLSVQNVNSSLDAAMSPASVPVALYPACALWLKASVGVITDPGGVNEWDDLSGNGNNLTQPNGLPFEPQLATNAVGDEVIRFAGTNETFMSAGDSQSLELTGDMTILTVVNFATLAGNTNGMIVSKTASNQPAPYDYYAWANTVRFLRGNGSVNAVVTSTSVPTTGVTHVMDVMMQGTTVTHRLDGQPNGSGPLATPIADPGLPLYIGTRADGVNRLSGDLSELIIVSSALSAGDLASIENYLVKSHQIVTVNPSPTNIVASVSGSQLTLSWPADHTGWTLQAQTNSTATGLSTNWVNVAGSTATNQVVIPADPANGSVFYRLIYQGN